jgi:hypothetical protein
VILEKGNLVNLCICKIAYYLGGHCPRLALRTKSVIFYFRHERDLMWLKHDGASKSYGIYIGFI